MKKIFTTIGVIFSVMFLSAVAFGQPTGTVYSKILYRLNAGSTNFFALDTDTSKLQWGNDHPLTPSPYIDTVIAGNKTYTVVDTILFDPSVPLTTPVKIFKSERSLSEFKPATELHWKFPVTATTLVEVRLYFAELFYTAAGQRVFDISIEGEKKLSNFDIAGEVGKFVGVAKTYVVEVDSNDTLDIVFSKVVGQPKVNGFEIVEITPVVQNIFSRKSQNTIAAYPNPCRDIVTLNVKNSSVSDVQLYNSYGQLLENTRTEQSGNDLKVDLSSQPSGVYLLKVTNDKSTETLRLIKQ